MLEIYTTLIYLKFITVKILKKKCFYFRGNKKNLIKHFFAHSLLKPKESAPRAYICTKLK